MSDMKSDVKQLKIEEFDLVSFVMQIQSAILQGYEVTDKSEEAPMCIGHCYHVIMRETAKPNITVGKLVMEASIDTTTLQEQLKAGGDVEQMLADSLVVEEVKEEAEEVHEKLIGIIPITNAYVETIEPPKEPTIDEALPKEEQVVQTKQVTIAATTTPKRGKKQ